MTRVQAVKREAAYVSGIDKSPVLGLVLVDETNLAGDGQADLENHGGPYRAILAYGALRYPHSLSAVETGRHG